MTKKTKAKTAAKPAVTEGFDEAQTAASLREYCEKNHLVWNEGNFQLAAKTMREAGLSTAQAVAVGKTHIVLVNHLFNPRAYSWRARFKLALHFIFNPRG